MNKFCIDCKYHKKNGSIDQCHAPSQYEVSLITGKNEYRPEYVTCSAQRLFHSIISGNCCGSDGKWFEPKDEVQQVREAEVSKMKRDIRITDLMVPVCLLIYFALSIVSLYRWTH